MKLSILTLGLIGGFLGALAALLLVSLAFPGLLAGNISNTADLKPQSTATPLITPVDYTLQLTSEASLSSVAIQTFQGDKLAKQGSGIIISSDGLILTTADVISGGTAVQVLFGDKIYKGWAMSLNRLLNLAILKIADVSDMTISELDNSSQFTSGQELILTGKTSLLSGPEVFTQKGLVNYVTNSEVLLDTSVSSYISGAKILSSSGKLMGMAYIRAGKVYALRAQVLSDFINKYLSK